MFVTMCWFSTLSHIWFQILIYLFISIQSSWIFGLCSCYVWFLSFSISSFFFVLFPSLLCFSIRLITRQSRPAKPKNRDKRFRSTIAWQWVKNIFTQPKRVEWQVDPKPVPLDSWTTLRSTKVCEIMNHLIYSTTWLYNQLNP